MALLLLWPTCGCCQLLVVSHQHQAIWPGRSRSHSLAVLVVLIAIFFSLIQHVCAAQHSSSSSNRRRSRSPSHGHYKSTSTSKTKTKCKSHSLDGQRRTCPFGNLIISFLSAAASANHSGLTAHSHGTLGRTLYSSPHSSSSNVSAVFLFSVIVLNQSQKSVIMTALLIVTAHSANCPGTLVPRNLQPRSAGQRRTQPKTVHTSIPIPCA